MAFVYVLKSLRGDRYYIGSTQDLRKRLEHHRGGFTPSTKRFGALELVFSQEYHSLKEAREIESRLKKLKRRDYIEKIVAEGTIKMRP